MNVPTNTAMNVVEIREPARKPSRTRSTMPAPAAPAAVAREARKAAVRANAQEVQAQRYSAGALGGIAAVITGLSLSHSGPRHRSDHSPGLRLGKLGHGRRY
jgi:hypothetical protein